MARRGSVAVRLAVGYGALVVGSMAVISAAFYFRTVGVLARGVDSSLQRTVARLAALDTAGGIDAVKDEIARLLHDNQDQETEDYLLLSPRSERLAGNLSTWPRDEAPLDRPSDHKVTRDGRSSDSRLLPHRLPDGSLLIVGRDMRDRRLIERLVWQALGVGGGLALLLAIGGAELFRRKLEERVAAIRRTTIEIKEGDFSRRVPRSGFRDEFERLSADVNHMLEWIEQLMDGVRHVSNAIAHDLRTPLTRVRNRLDEALLLASAGGPATDEPRLVAAAEKAIVEIDELIVVFDKLLQIAEAEAGARRSSFTEVPLDAVITDVVELYDATAEAAGITLRIGGAAGATALGDRDLIANALANLVDNALKYAGSGATVEVRAEAGRQTVAVAVLDDGPGIPAAERPKVTERFYRLDHSRSRPGAGLGLSIVKAIATLHEGTLRLEDRAPGVAASLVLPRAATSLRRTA